MRARQIGRLLRTVSHLRASQVWHRARLTLRRKRWSRRADAIDAQYRARAAAVAGPRWDHAGLAAVARHHAERRDPARVVAVARDALAGRFTFLGETRDLGFLSLGSSRSDAGAALEDAPASSSRTRSTSRSRTARRATRLATASSRWRAPGPPRSRSGGRASKAWWNERAVATRLLHWSAAGALGSAMATRDADMARPRDRAARALPARQPRLDLLANHLFRDAAALAFAHRCGAACPTRARSSSARCASRFADGAHVERCLMYHAVCLRRSRRSRTLCGDARRLAARRGRARRRPPSVLLGDGDIPMLGDGWRGEVDVQRLLAQARALETPSTPRAPEHASGLVQLARGPLRCVLRAGPHGPDYQLGHAHADLLAFDASYGTVRVVTDTGTGAYAEDPAPAPAFDGGAQHVQSTAPSCSAWSSSGRRGRARVLARLRGSLQWLVQRRLRGSPARRAQRTAVGGPAVGARCQCRSSSRESPASAPRRGAGGVRLALGGDAREQVAPLHEHFNETREMRQLVVETAASLPWLGGFWLRFGATSDARPSLALDARVARLRLDDGARSLAVDWDLGATGAAAVAIR
jgi:hypothetical protein